MAHNNKLKLDTTMLQSNTAHHLVQFIAVQRKFINKMVTKIDTVTKKLNTYEQCPKVYSNAEFRELSDNFEYIATKHLDALHKRFGTNIFNKRKLKEGEK